VLSGELQYIPVFHTSCSDVKSAVSSTPGIDNTTICLGLVEKAGITLCLKWRYLWTFKRCTPTNKNEYLEKAVEADPDTCFLLEKPINWPRKNEPLPPYNTTHSCWTHKKQSQPAKSYCKKA